MRTKRFEMRYKFFIPAVSFFLVLSVGSSTFADLSAEDALRVANQVKEVQAFLSFNHLNQALWEDCVEREVELSCESDWVTCIDNAWVVKYFLSAMCRGDYDERLGVTLVINSKTGDIISRFPEVEYFEDPWFCRNDDDCLAQQRAIDQRIICQNFIYYRTSLSTSLEVCVCQQDRCQREDQGGGE
jgi:hypothetical protein